MSADLGDRVHGAWLGRCIGCLAGKPVEGWSQENIASYLRATASYPLTGYIPFDPEKQAGGDFAVNVQARDQTRGNISRMVADDDIDYTILNLDIVSKYGREFTTEDVGEEWLSRLPYRSTFSAERQAYANLVRGMQPPASATYRNPFREWIGATIRADLFGYITPGNPQLASSLAFKDASLSHVRNGIYGEMFVAGVISAALASGDLEGSIRTGQSLIPRSSRLSEVVETVLALARRTESWEEALRGVQGAYDRYNHTHVLANVAVTVLALLFGEHDFRKTVSIAVMCGWDTDCNGATAGSIMGAILGTAGIPSDLAEPLNDRVRTTLSGQCELSLRALAERTTALCRAGRDPAAREV
jgi:ADP-ribosylglycohydrolase